MESSPIRNKRTEFSTRFFSRSQSIPEEPVQEFPPVMHDGVGRLSNQQLSSYPQGPRRSDNQTKMTSRSVVMGNHSQPHIPQSFHLYSRPLVPLCGLSRQQIPFKNQHINRQSSPQRNALPIYPPSTTAVPPQRTSQEQVYYPSLSIPPSYTTRDTTSKDTSFFKVVKERAKPQKLDKGKKTVKIVNREIGVMEDVVEEANRNCTLSQSEDLLELVVE